MTAILITMGERNIEGIIKFESATLLAKEILANGGSKIEASKAFAEALGFHDLDWSEVKNK